MFTATVRRIRHRSPPKPITGPTKVKVGFPAGKAAASNIEKAVWNEFGTRGGASGGGWGGPVPERPFMRNAARANRAKYRQAMKTAAFSIMRNTMSMERALTRLGIMAQGDIQTEITALSSPPNSPVTIALKGSSNPLIDSGEMRQAVTFSIEKG